jgi:hypothetical protein
MALSRRTLLTLPVAVPLLNLAARAAASDPLYFPPPDSKGGWRTLKNSTEIRTRTGIDTARLDEAFQYVRTTSQHGGLTPGQSVPFAVSSLKTIAAHDNATVSSTRMRNGDRTRQRTILCRGNSEGSIVFPSSSPAADKESSNPAVLSEPVHQEFTVGA